MESPMPFGQTRRNRVLHPMNSTAMTANDLAFINKSVPLLSHFTETQRKELAEGSEVRDFEPGQFIVYAGDEVHFLGVVLSGTVAA